MMKWWGKMQQEQGHYKDKHRRDANVQDNRDDNGTVRDRSHFYYPYDRRMRRYDRNEQKQEGLIEQGKTEYKVHF